MNSSIWYFPISAIINLVVCTTLLIYVSLLKIREKLARALLFMLLSVEAWAFFYLLWQLTSNGVEALFWTKGLMVGATFMPATFLNFVFVFVKNENKRSRYILAGFHLVALLFAVAVLKTNWIVSSVGPVSYFKYWPEAGVLFFPFLLYFFSCLVYAFIVLVERKRNSNNQSEILQANLIMLSMFIALIAGSSNYFLWVGINLAPWANIAVSIFLLIFFNTIIRFNEFNTKVVFTELFVGLLVSASLFETLLSENSRELTIRIGTLVSTFVFGIILSQSVKNEVRRRKEMSTLAQSLEKVNIRLKELDKQKTDFLTIAAHQLRTPMSIFNGYIELLRDGAYGSVTKESKDIFNNLDESNQRLVKLVDSFLDITKLEQGKTRYDFKKNNLNDVIDSVVKELDDRAKQKGLSLKWQKISLQESFFDEEKIRHVIFNFVDNAIKYSEYGTIEIVAHGEGDGVAVRVKDRGLGFEKIDEANFFQKFYRGNNVQGINVNGTGLGLYVCKLFIEAHRGKIWAHSDGLGKGSEFGFWIPVFSSEKAAPQIEAVNQAGQIV